MNFLSPQFFIFFLVITLIYFLLPLRGQRVWLLAASWGFYLYAGPSYFLCLMGVLAVAWGGALWLQSRTGRARKSVLALLLAVFFGALFLFKYLNFALNTLFRILGILGISEQAPALELILPAGISFYIFSAAGYLIDVYREKQAPERDFLTCALFLSFFPYLLSGPIGRAEELMPQFKVRHSFDYQRFRAGLLRFLWGAFKKLVIADRLGILVNTIYAAPESFGRLQVMAAALAFSVQIYCDFSAYSDMALGTAEAMGFALTENFRTPYFSRSIAEFWRRWHISLSSWLRDYLYIPLGGNRKGTVRKYFNVLIVFAGSGLWHGAGFTFIAWGLFNGLYQVAGAVTAGFRQKCRNVLHLREDGKITALWQILVTFLLSTATWVFFKAGSLSHALEIFKSMLTGPWITRPISAWGLERKEFLAAIWACLLLLAVDVMSLRGSVRERVLSWPRLVRWLVFLGLLLVTLIFGVYGTGYDPQDFIYFQF